MAHPTRMVVLRTNNLETLLQELWVLRPDLKDKPTATVHCGTIALIRETKLTLAALCPKSTSSGSVISMHQLAEASEPSREEDASAFLRKVSSEEPHPDSIWRQ